MAVTKIIAIRDRLDKRVNYVTNGEKTSLDAGITYAANPEKTEQFFFTAALNCGSVDTAFSEMMDTKRRFGKTGGVLGYHFIQSFAPGEVTPEQAHAIGVEFAKRLFGNRYEVVIGTHLDKHHLHNHLVVNSVSLLDGRKYHSSPGSYYFNVRGISDELCQEHDLSVITPQGKGRHYAEWKAEQSGKPTVREIIRADMDAIIGQAYTYDSFLMLLRKNGYEVRRNPNRKYTTVKPPGAKRTIRLDSLGKGYTEADILARLSRQRHNGVSPPVITYMPMERDGRDRYRGEYNDLLLDKAAESNNLIQEKYITISAEKKSVEDSRAFFSRVGTDLTMGLARMSSNAREITVNDRLRLFHDFFRPGEEQFFRFDLEDAMRKGHDFRDFIAPDCLCFKKDHYELGNCVGRTLFLREYASFISDSMITELTDYPRNMMLSIDIIPVAMDEAVSDIRRRIMAVESDITRWQQRQNQNNNFTANIPYDLEQMRSETKEFMDDLMSRDQRMMLALVTLTHLADDLEQLDQDTEALQAIGRARGCQFNILRYQQEDALNTVLPYGLKRIDATRTLTTECTAVLMPFKSQEIQDAGGIYYGVNAVSHNLIICNRSNLLNGNGFITGVSGSGKSMAAKQEISALALSTDHDIIIVDPEREYGALVQALGGEVITISASDPNGCHINALDMSEGYGDGKEPLVMKSEFIMSLYEQLMGSDKIEPQEKSIIDRSVGNIYREYIKNYQGAPPTLRDLYDDLMKQVNPEAHRIALALELFTVGSLNVFAHPTNINTKSRILCFDIQDLGENLKSVGLLVMLDAIYNRVIQNRKAGKFTHVYIDEIYLFFANGNGTGRSLNNYSSEFLYKCWKRFRKCGAMMTGITQNLSECLLSNTARQMLANSEFLLMLNQAPTDREQLARLLGASDTQMSYVDNAPAGHGLIKVGGAIVPFANELPKNTELYRLMSTKPGED